MYPRNNQVGFYKKSPMGIPMSQYRPSRWEMKNCGNNSEFSVSLKYIFLDIK